MCSKNPSVKNENQASPLIQVIFIVAAACLVYGVMQGVHDNYGIMMTGLLKVTGLDYAAISFCIGVGALIYGVAQPIMGMIALKRSNSFVLRIGIALCLIGLVVTPFCRSFFTLLLFFGIILPLGTTGLGFGIIMGAITPALGERRAAAISGLVQASAGIGDCIMSPALEGMIAGFGIKPAMWVLTAPFFIMLPVSFWLATLKQEPGSAAEAVDADADKNRSLVSILKEAFQDRDYRLLLISFGTCGFNMSIIESHLFSQYLSYGIDGRTASLTLTVYGITTMIGAAGAGFLSAKYRSKNVLACAYGLRVIISLCFLTVPKSVPFAFMMTALLGLCGDATPPPTQTIVTRLFGVRRMAMLYGFSLIGHQVGAFVSSYMGGLLVKYGYGYQPLWVVNMILAAIASTAAFMIRNDRAKAE